MSTQTKSKSRRVGHDFRIHKPRNTGDGAASNFQLVERDGEYGKNYMLFLEMAKQVKAPEGSENSAFGWKDKETKVVMKLGQTDIAEILMVLTGKKQTVGTGKGLFHENDNGNSVLHFNEYVKDDKLVGFALKITTKQGDVNNAVNHLVSPAEAEILTILLQRAIARMQGW